MPVVEDLVPPRRTGFLARLLPKREQKPLIEGPQDQARGFEAARKVVRDGVLDPRYKNASRYYTRIIVALPIVIYTTYELYRRRFLGVGQKAIPEKKVAVEQQDVKTREEVG